MHAHHTALLLGAMPEEYFAGTPREMPEHNIKMSKATFSSWDKGGWNYEIEHNH